MSSPVHFHHVTLVCTEYLFFVLNLILSLILLTYVLTNPTFDLLQKGKDLNRTLGSCTWEILTSYLGWRSLCTQMNSSERPTWYLAATLCTFPSSRLARLCWWIAPLLSYIDVRHTNFLPPSLRVGEARDLGPKYTTAEDLTFMRHDSAEHVSQSHRAHTCWRAWGLGASSRASIAELVNSSDVEVSQGEKMVKRKAMTIDRFFPGACLAAQSHSQGKDHTPPSPPAGHAKMKQRVGDQLPQVPSDAPSRTPPQVLGGITIREPVGDPWPTT